MKLLKFKQGTGSVQATYLRESVPGAGNWLVFDNGTQRIMTSAEFARSYKAPGRGDAKTLFAAAAEGTSVPVGTKPVYKFRGKPRQVSAFRIMDADAGPVGSWMVIDENGKQRVVPNEVFVRTYKSSGRGPAADAFKIALEQASQSASGQNA